MNFNGRWQFEIDVAGSGFKRGLLYRDLQSEITVPFCRLSKLSGIENVDFLEAVWYCRDVQTLSEWEGKRLLLHFQVCDYDTTVWVRVNDNGDSVEIGRHRGGFTSFTCNLNGLLKGGDKITIVVRARFALAAAAERQAKTTNISTRAQPVFGEQCGSKPCRQRI